jgi:putative ABC transport system permease protein
VRDAVVVIEMALATTLLAAAGLLCLSYLRLDRADPGFDVDHLLTLRLALNGAGYPPARRRQLLRRLEARVQALPQVAAAGFISTAPLAAQHPNEPFTFEPGASGPRGGAAALAAEWRVVSAGLLPALGLHLQAGRWLGAADDDRNPMAAVVDATVAERWWPGLQPLGRRLRWGAARRDLRVVGVVGGVRDLDLEAAPRPVVFLPYGAVPWRAMSLVVRPRSGTSAAGLASLGAAVRREVAALDPSLPASGDQLLEAARRQAVSGPRLGLWLVGLYAAAALALAVGGLYAAAAAAVVRRTAELAVRQALGAARGDVLRLVLGHGLRLAGAGLGLGIAGALLFNRLLGGLLFEPLAAGAHLAIYAGTAALLAAVASLAALLPARRAAAVAPVLALRRE